MAHSEINFRGYSFSAKDEPLFVWFDLIHSQIQMMDSPPEWLALLADRWMEKTVIPAGGIVEPYLDEFIINDERILILVDLSKCVLAEIELMRQRGKKFVALSDFGITVEPPRYEDASARTEYLIALGNTFKDLLEGKIQETLYEPRVVFAPPNP